MADLLVLGGTAWLGREVARVAVERGHAVTCLARGQAGVVADGVRWVRADRSRAGAYDEVSDHDWDAVVDVSWQPGLVRSAVMALGGRAAHWTYVSSCSVYADHAVVGADETAAVLAPTQDDSATRETYGEAKVACELAVTEALGDRAMLARAGLIGGPGDPSDRFGYWVGRFALAGDGPVLVPAAPDQPTQTIDVRDLAAWLVHAGEVSTSGVLNAVGEQHRLGQVLDEARRVAGGQAVEVSADPQWLQDNGIEGWAGARSLPLWLPGSDHAGFGARADGAAVAAGLTRRCIADTLADTLDDERARGLDRPRQAGLTRARELELLDALRQ